MLEVDQKLKTWL